MLKHKQVAPGTTKPALRKCFTRFALCLIIVKKTFSLTLTFDLHSLQIQWDLFWTILHLYWKCHRNCSRSCWQTKQKQVAFLLFYHPPVVAGWMKHKWRLFFYPMNKSKQFSSFYPHTFTVDGYWVSGSPSHHALGDRQGNTLFIHTCGKFTVSALLDLYVFGLWEEIGEPRGNPHKHRENMQPTCKSHLRTAPPRKQNKKWSEISSIICLFVSFFYLYDFWSMVPHWVS